MTAAKGRFKNYTGIGVSWDDLLLRENLSNSVGQGHSLLYQPSIAFYNQ